jgi:hypothetical protein
MWACELINPDDVYCLCTRFVRRAIQGGGVEGRTMNNYSIALFLHVVGALGFFVALGAEWTSLRHLRRATTIEQVREWIRIPTEMGRVGMIAILTLLAAGFYMMATVWGGVVWIIVALGAFVVIMILGMVVSRQRMAAIERAVTAEQGAMSPTLRQLLRHPLLWISIQTRVAIALGIVFLMTVKPDWSGSLLTIAVAIILGLASSLPILSRERVQEELVA